MRSRDSPGPCAARGDTYPCKRQPRLLASGYPNPLGTSTLCADALCVRTTHLDTVSAARASCARLQNHAAADAPPDAERTLKVRGPLRIGRHPHGSRTSALLDVRSPAHFRGRVFVRGCVGISSSAALRGASTASAPVRLDLAAKVARPQPPRAYGRGFTWEEGAMRTWGVRGAAASETCFVETLVADEGRLALQSLAAPGHHLVRHALSSDTWSDWIAICATPLV